MYWLEKLGMEMPTNMDEFYEMLVRFKNEEITDIDGVKIDFPDSWVHLRKSNTEPIIRIYSEAATMEQADALADEIKKIIKEITEKNA